MIPSPDSPEVSCVWCFQRLAREIGTDKYRNHLRKSAYGVLREPFDETNFWLDGSLEISAAEQVDFLKKVYRRALPLNQSSYETLRQIMMVEEKPAFKMFAKTGWGTKVKPQVGWHVGYIETSDDVWFFALNLETRDERDLPLRQKLTMEALQIMGIIE